LCPNLAPELHTVGDALAPAADQVGQIRAQHLPGPLGAARRGGRAPPQVGIDGGPTDAELPGDRGDASPLSSQRVDRLIDRDPRRMTTLLLCLLLLLAGVGTLTLPAIHRRDRHRGYRGGEGLDHAHGRRQQHRAFGDQAGFNSLAEVADEMAAVHDLHRLGCPATNAVRVEVTAITADDGDRRLLCQPGRECRGRAVRQEVYDAMRHEIDQDRAIAMTPPPGPLVDPNRLEGWHGRDWNPPDQAKPCGGTGGKPQAGGESGPGVPAQGQANRPKSCGQSIRVAAIGCDEVRHALGEHATCTGRVPAAELPDRELERYGARPPREVREVGLIATMDGR